MRLYGTLISASQITTDMKRLFVALMAGALTIPQMKSHDLEYDGIGYNIIGENEVEVTFLADGQKYKGNISIPGVLTIGENPDVITWNNPETLSTVTMGVSTDNQSDDASQEETEYKVYDVVRIGDYAFKDCTELVKLELPSVIKEIGIQAVSGCTGLSEITMPTALVKIEDEAFMGSSFKSMYIRDGLNEIGNKVFYGVVADDINFKYCKLTEFGEETFTGASIKRILLPRGLRSIPQNTFKGCTDLVYVLLNESLEEIGKDAFSYCENLTSLSLPKGLRSIDENAFRGTKIKSISFNDMTAPSYSIQSICGNTVPTLMTMPSESVGAYQQWCPDLLQNKVRFHVNADYYVLYWAYPGIVDIEDPNKAIPEGITGDYNEDSDIFIKKGEDLSIAFAAPTGGSFKYFINGNEVNPEDIFLPVDCFYLNNYPTSVLSSALLLKFSDASEDCEISFEPYKSAVGEVYGGDTDCLICYNPTDNFIIANNETINIYSVAGKKIKSGFGCLYVGNLTPGIYIVKTGKLSKKIAVH